MLITITDKNGLAQTIIANSQEAIVDKSGTIAATGVSQQAVAANLLRSGLFIQNLSATNPMYFNFGTAAVVGQPSVKLAPGERMNFPKDFPIVTSAMNIIGTVSDQFTIKEW